MLESFSKDIRIEEPECDVNKRLRLSGFMRHAQQMGADHLLRLGIDYNRMYQDGMVFLVNKMLITMKRRPEFGEQVRLTTVPRKPKGAQFIRDTYFETTAGEQLAEVSISWMLINPTTRKILRPSVFDVYGFEMFPNEGEYITGYRIKKPEQSGVLHLRQVKYSDLDYNHHVNNAVYADIVCDMIPADTIFHGEMERFGISYQKEATIGQILEMEVVSSWSGMNYYIGGIVSGERCFEAEIKFR